MPRDRFLRLRWPDMLILLIVILSIYWTYQRFLLHDQEQHYALFLAIVWTFLWYQISGSLLCFTNTLSAFSSSLVILLPIVLALSTNRRFSTQKEHNHLLPFLPFLPHKLLSFTWELAPVVVPDTIQCFL